MNELKKIENELNSLMAQKLKSLSSNYDLSNLSIQPFKLIHKNKNKQGGSIVNDNSPIVDNYDPYLKLYDNFFTFAEQGNNVIDTVNKY